MAASVKKQILEQVTKLPLAQQRLVLSFASSLTGKIPRGVPGKELLAFAGSIKAADLESMSRAIDEGCERVDVNGW